MTEQLYITAIICLGEEAYGVKIREKIIKLTGKPMVFGTLYNNLDQLVRKEYVVTRKDRNHADSKKVFYKVSDLGKEALMEAKKLQKLLWTVIPEHALR